MPATADVIVVGGGAIGCAIARALALARRRVVLCEAGPAPGREASAAAAGVINAQGEHHRGDFLRLCVASRARFAAFVRAVERESGVDTAFAATGYLEVALAPADDARLDAWAGAQRAEGLAFERWDAARVRAAAPAVTDVVRGGLFLPDESSIDCRALCDALARAAVRAGAEIRVATPIERVRDAGGRAIGVRTKAGEDLDAGTVVVAAGAWSSLQGSLPFLPVRPAKGQMLAFASESVRFAQPIVAGGLYLVPRPGGRLLCGATVEDAGFDTRNTVGGVQRLLAGAIALCPALRDAALTEHWAGLRPRTPDDRPILGPTPLPGLLAATGHFRNGMLLAPITAELVTAWCTGASLPFDAAPFAARRFASAGKES